MTKLSQSKRILEFLKATPDQRFNSRQIAEAIVVAYPTDYEEKRQNPRFANESAFIGQIVAEIGAQREQVTKLDPHIFCQDKPRPRLYWYDPNRKVGEVEPDITDENNIEDIDTPKNITTAFSEQDLYPILIEYLKTELSLYCQRIDERRSKNTRGTKGNHWLHPDIVAMQPMDTEWNSLIQDCVKLGAGQRARLWSFEVKKELSRSNARTSFFQAVSNSSWANEGYLVATKFSDNATEKELRMLSALHGIGVILLNIENPTESDMILPSRTRPEVDWESVNRILLENDDFKNYIDLVSAYYQTGRVRARDWNKIQ